MELTDETITKDKLLEDLVEEIKRYDNWYTTEDVKQTNNSKTESKMQTQNQAMDTEQNITNVPEIEEEYQNLENDDEEMIQNDNENKIIENINIKNIEEEINEI